MSIKITSEIPYFIFEDFYKKIKQVYDEGNTSVRTTLDYALDHFLSYDKEEYYDEYIDCYWAVEDSKVVGFVYLTENDLPEETEISEEYYNIITSLYVFPDYRGLSVGKKLLEALKEDFGDEGLCATFIEDQQGEFYLYNGFKQSKEQENLVLYKD